MGSLSEEWRLEGWCWDDEEVVSSSWKGRPEVVVVVKSS